MEIILALQVIYWAGKAALVVILVVKALGWF